MDDKETKQGIENPEAGLSDRDDCKSRYLLDIMPYGVVLVHQSGEILYMNRQFRQILELREEYNGTVRDWLSQLHEDQQELAAMWSKWERDLEAMRGGESRTAEISVLTGSGRRIVVRFQGTCAGNDEYLFSMEDITRLAITRQEKEINELKYRQLFQYSPDGLLLMDRGRIVEANPRWLEMLEVTEDEAIGTAPWDWSPPSQPDGLTSMESARARIGAAMKGVNRPFEWIHKTRTGRHIFVDVILQRVNIREHDYVLAIVRDVSEKIRHAAELEASEERFRIMMEESPLSTQLYDTRGNLISSNKAWHRMIGLDISVNDRDIRYNILEDDQALQQGAASGFSRALEGEHSYLPEIHYDPAISNLPGRERYFRLYIYPLRDSHGEIVNVVLIHDDITSQKQRDKQAAEYLERTEKQRKAVLDIIQLPQKTTDRLLSKIRNITEIVTRIADVPRASIWLLDRDGQELICIDLYLSDEKRHSDKSSVLRTRDFPQYIKGLRSERAIVADDAVTNEYTSEFGSIYLAPEGILSMLDAPIRIAGELIGVLCLEETRGLRVWLPDEVNFCAEISDQIGQIIHNRHARIREHLDQAFYRYVSEWSLESDDRRLYEILFDHLTDALEVGNACIHLHVPKKTPVAYRFWNGQLLESLSCNTEEVFAFIRRAGEPVIHTRCGAEAPLIVVDGTAVDNWMGAPLYIDSEVVGVLMVWDPNENRVFLDGDRQALAYAASEFMGTWQRLRIERELHEQKEKLELVLEGAELVLWDWNLLEGSVTHNSRLEKILGYDSLPEDHDSFLRLIHPADYERVGLLMEQHLAGETPLFEAEYRFRKKDGSAVWVMDRGRVVKRDADGKPVRVSGTVLDVSARKQAIIYRDMLFNYSLDLMCIAGFDGYFKQLNPSWQKTLGWSVEDMLSVPWNTFLHPDDVALTDSASEQLLQGQPVFNFENRYRCKNGRWRTLSWNSFPMPDEKLIFAVVRDVTDTREVRQALQESETRYRSIFLTSPMGIHNYELNPRGELIFMGANPASEKILGTDFNHFSGQTIETVFPSMKDTGIPERYSEIARNGDIWHASQVNYEDNKVSGAYEVYAFQTKPGAVSAMFLDITERIRSEEETRRLRNLLRNIIDSMPNILIGIDEEGRINQWNRQAVEKTGREVGETLGMKLNEVLPQFTDRIDNFRSAIQHKKVLRESKVAHVENGEKRYTDLTVYPLISNGVEGAVILLEDVTEKVRIDEMIVQSEKMLTVGGLAAGMAHEINNPLAGILQNTQVIRNRLLEDLPKNRQVAGQCDTTIEHIKSYVEKRNIPAMMEAILDSGARAARIVENMLSFSRKGDSVKTREEITDILDTSLELASSDYNLKKQYDFKNISIRKEYQPGLPSVMCSRNMIQQVILNILKNGAEAMTQKDYPKGQEPRFVIRATRADEYLRIDISDNGPGMEEEVRKRVFEPFFTTKAIGLGTGLGLSVSYFIVTENHSGRMEVDSIPGEGTSFSIFLPVGEVV